MRMVLSFILLLLFIPSFIEAESPPDPVFYRNDGIDIEFRILLEDQENIPWIMMWDREGLPQRVSKEIVISNNDIAGFTIDDYKPIFDDDDGFIIYFEPNSWKKIRETTDRLKGIRVAFLRNEKIFSSSIIFEALTRSTTQHLGDTEISVEGFLKGLPIEKLPEHIHSKTIYEQFLLDWIDSHPKDWETIRELVNHYFKDRNNINFKKAVAYAQKFVKAKPNNSEMQIRLMECYQLIGNNEKALATSIQALSHASSLQKIFIHRVVAKIQYNMGNERKAVKSLETSLEILRELESLITKGKITPENSIKENGRVVYPKLEDMIQEVNDRINFIMAH